MVNEMDGESRRSKAPVAYWTDEDWLREQNIVCQRFLGYSRTEFLIRWSTGDFFDSDGFVDEDATPMIWDVLAWFPELNPKAEDQHV